MTDVVSAILVEPVRFIATAGGEATSALAHSGPAVGFVAIATTSLGAWALYREVLRVDD